MSFRNHSFLKRAVVMETAQATGRGSPRSHRRRRAMPLGTPDVPDLTPNAQEKTFNSADAGQILTFNYGEPFDAEPQLLAALTAAGAPGQ